MTTDHEPTQPPSDVYANPQDTAFGHAAAEDQERVEQGEEPEHDDATAPRAGAKADPASTAGPG